MTLPSVINLTGICTPSVDEVCQVGYEPETRRIAALSDARLFENRYPSPQPFLWDLGDLEWHLVRRLPAYRPRRKPAVIAVQERLFPHEEQA
jgi:hypothetical protein